MKIVNAHLRPGSRSVFQYAGCADAGCCDGDPAGRRLVPRCRSPAVGRAGDLAFIAKPFTGPTMKIVNAHLRRQEALFTLEPEALR
jgi:hypothetical protein